MLSRAVRGNGAVDARRAAGEHPLRVVFQAATLAILAFAVRMLPWPTVYDGERVIFFGMDAWYHMRRVLFSMLHGTAPLAFDPYLNFPTGAKPIWSPLFDQVLAWLLIPMDRIGGVPAVELGAALVPPLLGATTVVAAFLLARRLFDARVGMLAGVLLSLLSAHFWYSQVGFVDHHAAVALLSLVVLAATVAFVGAAQQQGDVSRRRFASAAAAGCVAALLLLLWPGSLLHVGMTELALLVFLVSRERREDASRVAMRLVVLYALAAMITLPAGVGASWPGWSPFSPAVLSLFQPWMFGGLALHSLACALLWTHSDWGGSIAARSAQAVGLGLALVGLSLLAFPELLTGAAEAWRWFAKDEVFQELVKESKPLFYGKEGLDFSNAELRLSRFVWLSPFALVALALRAWRSPRRAQLLVVVGWALGLAVVTVLQRRFFNSFAPVFAIVMAWASVAAVRSLPAAFRGSRWRRLGVRTLAAGLVLWLLLPTLAAYQIPFRNLMRSARGAPLTVPKAEISRRALLETARWIRENTPPTSGYHDPAAEPEYGLLAAWGYGHLLKYVAQRPTVVGNFGDDVGQSNNMQRVDAYWKSREPGATKLLRDMKVRYVVVQTLGRVPPARLEGGAMRKRLSLDDSPGLQHHRLLYESPLSGLRATIGRSEFRVFEHVEGAVIHGQAAPGAVVSATLGYQSNRGRRGVYEVSARAGEDGRYRLRVPYATVGAPPGTQPDRAYQVRAPGRMQEVQVRDEQVRRGDEIEGPDLRPG